MSLNQIPVVSLVWGVHHRGVPHAMLGGPSPGPLHRHAERVQAHICRGHGPSAVQPGSFAIGSTMRPSRSRTRNCSPSASVQRSTAEAESRTPVSRRTMSSAPPANGAKVPAKHTNGRNPGLNSSRRPSALSYTESD